MLEVWQDEPVPVDALTPYAHVADVQRSVDFYGLIGLELRNSFEQGGRLAWAFVTSPSADPNDASARLMLAQADGPFDASQQAVLFYCWARNLESLQAELSEAGVEVGDITHPFYMPAGELRVIDPDGYVVLVGRLS